MIDLYQPSSQSSFKNQSLPPLYLRYHGAEAMPIILLHAYEMHSLLANYSPHRDRKQYCLGIEMLLAEIIQASLHIIPEHVFAVPGR